MVWAITLFFKLHVSLSIIYFLLHLTIFYAKWAQINNQYSSKVMKSLILAFLSVKAVTWNESSFFFRCFCLVKKNFPKDIFNSKICYRYDFSNWALWCTVQRVMVLVISNQPRASRSSEFERTRAITPWTVLHSVQLLTTRRSKIVSRAKATIAKYLPRAAVSFNFTGQSLRLPDECGPYHFGPVSTKRWLLLKPLLFVKPLCTPLSSQLSPRVNSLEIVYVVSCEWKARMVLST